MANPPLRGDAFVTEEHIKNFRGTSMLLSLTEPSQSREGHKSSKSVHPTATNNQIRDYVLLSDLCNVLIRRSEEAMAIIPGDVFADRSEIIAFTMHDPWEAPLPSEVQREKDQLPKITVAFAPGIRPETKQRFQRSPIYVALSQWPKGIPGIQQPTLAEHCHLIATLLRECHQPDSLGWVKTKRRELLQYVLVSSYDAIYENRLKPGWSRHSFWKEFVTDLDTTLGGDFLRDAEGSEELSDTLPDDGQRKFFKALLERPESPITEDYLTSPVFDAQGRRRLLILLRTLLIRTRQAFESIKQLTMSWKEKCANEVKFRQEQYEQRQNTKRTDTVQQRDYDIQKLVRDMMAQFVSSRVVRNVLLDLMRSQDALDWFCTSFQSQIKAASAWLARSRGLHSTDLDLHKDEYSNTHSPGAPDDAKSSGSIGDDLPSSENLDISDEDLEYKDLVESDSHGYGAALFKWLQLVVLHYSSINNLLHEDKSKMQRHFLQTLKIRNIEAVSKFRDFAHTSLEDVLQQYIGPAFTLEQQDGSMKDLKDWLSVQMGTSRSPAKDFVQTDAFRGAIHCETSLLTLHELALGLQAKSKSDEELNSALAAMQSHFSIQPDVLRCLTKISDLLAVSKRCCPACTGLVEHMKTALSSIRQEFKLTYLSSLTVWFPVTLPPWTLKETAAEVTEAARAELLRRLRQILKNQRETTNRRKRMPSVSKFAGDPSRSMEQRANKRRARSFARRHGVIKRELVGENKEDDEESHEHGDEGEDE